MGRMSFSGIASLLRSGLARTLSRNLRPAPSGAEGSREPALSIEPLESRRLLSSAGIHALRPSPLEITASVVSGNPSVAQSASGTLANGYSSVQVAWVNNAGRVRVTQVYMAIGKSRTWSLLAQMQGTGGSQLTTPLRQGRSYAFDVQEILLNRSTVSSSSVSLAVPVVPTVIDYSSPIVITQGGTYQGNWESLDPDVPAVEIQTSDPVIIENSNISSRGTLIEADGDPANLVVENTNGYGLNPDVAGMQAGRFLDVESFTNLVVENNNLQGTGGIYVTGYAGDSTPGQSLHVLYNVANNIDGRLSDGNGGYEDVATDNYVQFFQANGLQNIRGAEVAWNQVINQVGQSAVEDNISIFNTTGTPDSPFAIHDNYIYGAFSIDPATDGDYTGGGIMVSDQGSAYISAYNNQVLETSEYGIGISSGHDNQFYNNVILSDGVLADGTPIAAANIGAYVWNENGELDFSNNSAYNNIVGWNGSGGRDDYWLPDVANSSNNQSVPGTITSGTVAAQWNVWLSKVASAGVVVGVTS